ncbi:MAG: hypothetical protein SVX43_09185 [Cyanobacteriota bacterium]|nr:hypothetical protein [Cyanobacteriota bacterium]
MGSSLNEVVRDLEQHERSLRIRKMLFCAARSQWENNRDALLSVPMRDLVEELLDLNSTLDQLSISLYEIVKGVNRQTEYSLVANTIISILGKLYDDSSESTQVVAFKPQKNQDEAIAQSSIRVRKTAQTLNSHSESLRLRKLLYCLGNNQWLNETEPLLAANLEELVQQTYQLHPTLARLSLSLQNIVDSLNRKTEYSAVANSLIDCFEPLYSNDEDDTTHSNQTEPTQPPPATAPPPKNSVPPTAPLSSPVIATPSPKSLEELNAQLARDSNRYDPFNVRLEVLKYSNPLRAKILTFSILEHPFDYKGKDWSSLRTIELDRLLLDAYQQHQTLSDLEAKLYEMAQTLDDPEESLQAASAIAKAMKPFYPPS